MSFDEFVEGLKQFRITQEVKKQQEQAEEKKSVVQEALEAAIASFEDANWGADKELDMPGFIDAFLDPIVAAQIQMATGLPQEWFDSLSYERLEQIFHEIDDNGNGTLDFEEWVTYLVQVRINTYEEQKEEERIEKEIENQLMDAAEDIFEDADEDWSGEFEFEEFVKAFRANPKFLRKVAAACDIPFEALEALGDMEISQLFDEFDTDKSGAISFEEFVKGLAKIRFIREKAKDEEEADDDDAFMDLQTAFEDADFSAEGELTYEDFSDALKDKNIVRTLARVTKIQEGILRAMDEGTKGEWFDQIDTDSSGTIDFNEWITAFMEIRKSMTEEMEQEFAALRASQMFCEDMAADAFDQVDADFINGLTLDKFLIAFRKNKGFVQNVAKAMNLHENYLRQLGDKELEAWFMELDSDFSGTVDFQEFVAGLVKIRELHFGDVDGMEDPGSPGLPPYVLPEFVRNLPELSEEAKSNLANAFKKYDKSAMGFDCEAATVASLLRDVHLVVDEKAAKKYIETAFPGKDLSKGLQLEDCEVLYKVALDAQPLWSKPLAKSASAGSLTVKDMQSQELRLRKIFDKYANSVSNLGIGAIEVDAVGPLLKDIGCMDTADYTPRYLDSFFKNRAPGPVQFPEIVGLCNAAMHHQLMACPSTTSLTLSKSLSQSASQLAKKGCKLPPIELGPMGKPLSGSPAIALRRKRSSPARIDMASATALQAWKN
jgi:Ca2+-binding EF-hand superfamily protein